MQQSFTREVIDILSTAPEKTKILDALNRVADEDIALALMFHVAGVAGGGWVFTTD